MDLTPIQALAIAKRYTDTHGGGTGGGDMMKSVYDEDNSVATAGGIKSFVYENKPEVQDKQLLI